MVDPLAISHSSQCSTIGITKAMVWSVCGMMHIKDPLMLNEKISPCSGSIRFSFTELSFTI